MAVERFFERERVDAQMEEVGIGDFTLLANVAEVTKFTSDVPDTFLEDGSTVQDHIILKPTVLEIKGNVANINIAKSKFDEFVSRVQNTLGLIGLYAGGKTASQIQAANNLISDVAQRVDQINDLLEDGEQVLSFFGLNVNNTAAKTNPELFINAMEAAHFGKQLLSINMPFRTYDNMRIIAFTSTKDNQTDGINYTLTAKKVRFAKTLVAEAKKPSSNLGGQTQNKNNAGTQTGTQVEPEKRESILSALGSFGSSDEAGS